MQRTFSFTGLVGAVVVTAMIIGAATMWMLGRGFDVMPTFAVGLGAAWAAILVHRFHDRAGEQQWRNAFETSERRFRDFAETTADWFWELDAQYRFRFISEASYQITCRRPESLYGLSPLEHRPDGVSDADWQAHVAALANKQSFHDFRFETTDLQGRRRVVSVSGKPVHDDQGRFAGYRGISTDFTEVVAAQKRLEAALERERATAAHQKRFVAVAAHEFRLPLTIIDGAAQRLLRAAARLTPEELRERVERIRTSVGRMAQLIETTLDSARFDGERIALKRAPVDLVALLKTICERQRGLSTEFTFAIASDVDQLTIDADPRLLDMTFTNLVNNAVKYSGDSRRVEVTLCCETDRVRVAIRDFGLGMAADDLSQLFTRFFRAGTAKDIPGTGIGLHLVKELVGAHDGAVTVRSAPGEGSVFEVTLPLSGGKTEQAAVAA